MKDALAAVLAAIPAEILTEESAKAIVDAVVKEKGVKKGLVMKSLRAGLTGSLKGPERVFLVQKGRMAMYIPRAAALSIMESTFLK